MPKLPTCPPLPVLTALLLTCSLTACGGGGGPATAGAITEASISASSSAAVDTSSAVTDNLAAGVLGKVAVADALTTDALAAAGQTSSGGTDATVIAVLDDRPTATIQGLSGITAAGVREATSTSNTATATPVVTGVTYYVDSAAGNDTATGKAATTGSGNGPWKSLARLAMAALQPGDRVVLACGSVWNETLSLASSGTVSKPIVVGLPDLGCTVAPAVDGSVSIAATAWQSVGGLVYRSTFAQKVLQLHGAGDRWLPAHHPNRGYISSAPASPYLMTTGKGDTVVLNGGTRSTSVVVGTSLSLPSGAAITPGTVVRLRPNSWTIEERTVSEYKGGKLLLSTPTGYTSEAGWGYFLMGQAWMVDSAGEWHHDLSTQRLTVAWPVSGAPNTPVLATVLPVGVDLQGRTNIALSGLQVRRVGTGLKLQGSTSVRLQSLRVEDIAGVGAEAAGTTSLIIESSSFQRTLGDAIQGIGNATAEAQGMVIRRNLVTDSGAWLVNGVQLRLPGLSYAAIYASPGTVVEENTVRNSGYIGIRFMRNSTVDRNLVEDSCLVLNDCSGIYTWGAGGNNSVVTNNVVQRAQGNVDGVLAGIAPAAQGFYLDDQVSGVLLANNTATEANNGIHIHNAFRNTIRDNVLFNNQRSQLWMQSDSSVQRQTGDVFENVVSGNMIGATVSDSIGLWLTSKWASTSTFGTFTGNRYLDTNTPVVAQERTSTGTRSLSFFEWQASSAIGSTTPVDATGTSVRSLPYTAYTPVGTNLVSNAKFAANTAGWTSWNPTLPKSSLQRLTCTVGTCLRYVPGGGDGLVSSPNFSVVQGQWYRLSVDLLADTDNQPVYLVVRRGGGGGNGYETLADRPLSLRNGTAWKRQVVVFKATKTVNQGDTATLDLGARVDIEQLKTGLSVTLANLELVPITVDEGSIATVSLMNKTTSTQSMTCPMVGAQAGACTSLRRLSTTQLASWPIALGLMASDLLFSLNPALVDTDRDGIPDVYDKCPGTPLGQGTNAAGCAIGQL